VNSSIGVSRAADRAAEHAADLVPIATGPSGEPAELHAIA
jgi:hypothetical protein